MFPVFPQNAPVHRYRHIFAQRLARPVHQIPRKDRYICRAERKGYGYDKRAMRMVSKALGHNRLGASHITSVDYQPLQSAVGDKSDIPVNANMYLSTRPAQVLAGTWLKYSLTFAEIPLFQSRGSGR